MTGRHIRRIDGFPQLGKPGRPFSVVKNGEGVILPAWQHEWSQRFEAIFCRPQFAFVPYRYGEETKLAAARASRKGRKGLLESNDFIRGKFLDVLEPKKSPLSSMIL